MACGSVLQLGNGVRHIPLPSFASNLDLNIHQDQLEDDIGTNCEFPVYGGFIGGGQLAWRASGPTVEIIDPGLGTRKAAWTFGAIMHNAGAKVTTVCGVGVGTVSQVAVGVDLGADRKSQGLVALLSLRSSRITRVFHFPHKVTALTMVSGGQVSIDTAILAPELRPWHGILVIGTAHGTLHLLDLALDLGGHKVTSDELSPGTLKSVITPDPNAERNRASAVRQHCHPTMCLSDGMSRGGRFQLIGPDDSILFETSSHLVNITAVSFVPQLASLIVGYCFGAFQIINLSSLTIDCTSPYEENVPPVHSFACQEPENDPKNFVYLWLCRSWNAAENIQENPEKLIGNNAGASLCTMYAMNYDNKLWIEGHGLWYQGLASISPRFEFNAIGGLGIKGQPAQPSCVFAAMTVHQTSHISAIAPGASAGMSALATPDDDSGPVPEQSLCFFGWAGGVLDHGKITVNHYLAVFDINQWYQAQMPSSLKLSENHLCPYMSFHILDRVPGCSTNGNLSEVVLGAAPKPSSWARHMSPSCNENDWFPASLSFDSHVLTSKGLMEYKCQSAQQSALNYLVNCGPSAIVNPEDAYSMCLFAGLISHDSPPSIGSSMMSEREALLTVAMDEQLVSFLIQCIGEFSDGRFTSLGCSLPSLLEWAWSRVCSIKTANDSLCMPLFDVDAGVMSPSNIATLHQNLTSLASLSTVISSIRDSAHTNMITFQGAKELDNRVQVVGLLMLHLSVVLWFYHCGLLTHTNGLEDVDECHHVPFPSELLHRIYKNRRLEIKNLSSTLKGNELLLIDGLLEDSTGGAGGHVNKAWIRDDEEVVVADERSSYPPPSLHALLDIFLIPSVSTTTKHRIIQYLFLDLASLLSDGYVRVVEELVKYPSSFSLSPSLIKLTQAFWLIDHKDFQEGLNVLLDPLVSTRDITPQQHQRIVKAFLYQGEHTRALTYTQIRQPPRMDTDDIRLHLTLLLANGLIREAFHFQRHHRLRDNTQDLLNHLFTGCEQLGKLESVIHLPLSPLEEQCLISYLQSSSNKAALDFLLVYYLQRSRYEDAAMLQDSLRGPYGLDRKRHESRNTLVHAYLTHLPDVAKRLAFGNMSKDKPIRKMYTRPQPLSAKIFQSKYSPKSNSSMLSHMQESSWSTKAKAMPPITPFRTKEQRRRVHLGSDEDEVTGEISLKRKSGVSDISQAVFPSRIMGLQTSSYHDDEGDIGLFSPAVKRSRQGESWLLQENMTLQMEAIMKKSFANVPEETAKSPTQNISVDLLSLLSTPKVSRKKRASRSHIDSLIIDTPQSILKVKQSIQRPLSPSASSDASLPLFPRIATSVKRSNIPVEDTLQSKVSETSLTPKQLRFHLPKGKVVDVNTRLSTDSDKSENVLKALQEETEDESASPRRLLVLNEDGTMDGYREIEEDEEERLSEQPIEEDQEECLPEQPIEDQEECLAEQPGDQSIRSIDMEDKFERSVEVQEEVVQDMLERSVEVQEEVDLTHDDGETEMMMEDQTLDKLPEVDVGDGRDVSRREESVGEKTSNQTWMLDEDKLMQILQKSAKKNVLSQEDQEDERLEVSAVCEGSLSHNTTVNDTFYSFTEEKSSELDEEEGKELQGAERSIEVEEGDSACEEDKETTLIEDEPSVLIPDSSKVINQQKGDVGVGEQETEEQKPKQMAEARKSIAEMRTITSTTITEDIETSESFLVKSTAQETTLSKIVGASSTSIAETTSLNKSEVIASLEFLNSDSDSSDDGGREPETDLKSIVEDEQIATEESDEPTADLLALKEIEKMSEEVQLKEIDQQLIAEAMATEDSYVLRLDTSEQFSPLRFSDSEEEEDTGRASTADIQDVTVGSRQMTNDDKEVAIGEGAEENSMEATMPEEHSVDACLPQDDRQHPGIELEEKVKPVSEKKKEKPTSVLENVELETKEIEKMDSIVSEKERRSLTPVSRSPVKDSTPVIESESSTSGIEVQNETITLIDPIHKEEEKAEPTIVNQRTEESVDMDYEENKQEEKMNEGKENVVMNVEKETKITKVITPEENAEDEMQVDDPSSQITDETESSERQGTLESPVKVTTPTRSCKSKIESPATPAKSPKPNVESLVIPTPSPKVHDTEKESPLSPTRRSPRVTPKKTESVDVNILTAQSSGNETKEASSLSNQTSPVKLAVTIVSDIPSSESNITSPTRFVESMLPDVSVSPNSNQSQRKSLESSVAIVNQSPSKTRTASASPVSQSPRKSELSSASPVKSSPLKKIVSNEMSPMDKKEKEEKLNNENKTPVKLKESDVMRYPIVNLEKLGTPKSKPIMGEELDTIRVQVLEPVNVTPLRRSRRRSSISTTPALQAGANEDLPELIPGSANTTPLRRSRRLSASISTPVTPTRSKRIQTPLKEASVADSSDVDSNTSEKGSRSNRKISEVPTPLLKGSATPGASVATPSRSTRSKLIKTEVDKVSQKLLLSPEHNANAARPPLNQASSSSMQGDLPTPPTSPLVPSRNVQDKANVTLPTVGTNTKSPARQSRRRSIGSTPLKNPEAARLIEENSSTPVQERIVATTPLKEASDALTQEVTPSKRVTPSRSKKVATSKFTPGFEALETISEDSELSSKTTAKKSKETPSRTMRTRRASISETTEITQENVTPSRRRLRSVGSESTPEVPEVITRSGRKRHSSMKSQASTEVEKTPPVQIQESTAGLRRSSRKSSARKVSESEDEPFTPSKTSASVSRVSTRSVQSSVSSPFTSVKDSESSDVDETAPTKKVSKRSLRLSTIPDLDEIMAEKKKKSTTTRSLRLSNIPDIEEVMAGKKVQHKTTLSKTLKSSKSSRSAVFRKSIKSVDIQSEDDPEYDLTPDPLPKRRSRFSKKAYSDDSFVLKMTDDQEKVELTTGLDDVEEEHVTQVTAETETTESPEIVLNYMKVGKRKKRSTRGMFSVPQSMRSSKGKKAFPRRSIRSVKLNDDSPTDSALEEIITTETSSNVKKRHRSGTRASDMNFSIVKLDTTSVHKASSDSVVCELKLDTSIANASFDLRENNSDKGNQTKDDHESGSEKSSDKGEQSKTHSDSNVQEYTFAQPSPVASSRKSRALQNLMGEAVEFLFSPPQPQGRIVKTHEKIESGKSSSESESEKETKKAGTSRKK